MPNELQALEPDEVSLVGKAANRRRFLIRKGATMAMDEVKALEALAKLDEQGNADLVEVLAGEDFPELERFEKAEGMTHEMYKKVRAAMKIMGSDLCKSFPRFAKVLAMDPEEEQEDEDAADSDEQEDGKKIKGGNTRFGDEPGAGDANTGRRFAQGKKKRKAHSQSEDEDMSKSDVEKEDADALRERVTKAETELAQMRDQKEREGFIRKAATELDHLPGATADDLGGILQKASKALQPKEYERLLKVLTTANTVIAKSALFGEIGSGTEGGNESVQSEIQRLAVELRKSEKSLTDEQARALVIKSRPDLYARMTAEQDERIRKGGRR